MGVVVYHTPTLISWIFWAPWCRSLNYFWPLPLNSKLTSTPPQPWFYYGRALMVNVKEATRVTRYQSVHVHLPQHFSQCSQDAQEAMCFFLMRNLHLPGCSTASAHDWDHVIPPCSVPKMEKHSRKVGNFWDNIFTDGNPFRAIPFENRGRMGRILARLTLSDASDHTSNCWKSTLFIVWLTSPAHLNLPEIWIIILKLPKFRQLLENLRHCTLEFRISRTSLGPLTTPTSRVKH